LRLDSSKRHPINSRGSVVLFGYFVCFAQCFHLADVDVQSPETPGRFTFALTDSFRRHYPALRLSVSLRSFHPDVSVFPDRVVGRDLRIVLFEDCSVFTRVAACALALSPICDTLIEGFSHFVTP
jgi:hypothetical protein